MNYVTTEDGTIIALDSNGNPIIDTGIFSGGGSGSSGSGSTYEPPTPQEVSGASIPNTSIVLPTADFTYTLYADGFVGFINNSLGNISAYFWQFGDGKTSTSPRGLHQYSVTGTYQVTLTVANSSGSSTKTIAVNVTSVAYVVDFTFSVGDTTVQFTDISTKPGDRSWDFGDGQTSLETSPYHAYASNGVYLASLMIGVTIITHQVVVDRGVRLDWQDNSSDETGFKIERSPNGTSGWTQIATTSAGVNSLLVTLNIHGVDPTAVNYFRVRATNANGDSAYTNIVTSQCL